MICVPLRSFTANKKLPNFTYPPSLLVSVLSFLLILLSVSVSIFVSVSFLSISVSVFFFWPGEKQRHLSFHCWVVLSNWLFSIEVVNVHWKEGQVILAERGVTTGSFSKQSARERKFSQFFPCRDPFSFRPRTFQTATPEVNWAHDVISRLNIISTFPIATICSVVELTADLSECLSLSLSLSSLSRLRRRSFPSSFFSSGSCRQKNSPLISSFLDRVGTCCVPGKFVYWNTHARNIYRSLIPPFPHDSTQLLFSSFPCSHSLLRTFLVCHLLS